MLQISIWEGLRELGIGVSLQHYNPIIDNRVKEKFGIEDNYKILAQMVFGGIVEEPESKEKETDIDMRVSIVKWICIYGSIKLDLFLIKDYK